MAASSVLHLASRLAPAHTRIPTHTMRQIVLLPFLYSVTLWERFVAAQHFVNDKILELFFSNHK